MRDRIEIILRRPSAQGWPSQYQDLIISTSPAAPVFPANIYR